MSSLIYESSSTFTVPKGVKKIDVFCVGGGGGRKGSSAAGGGYTTTVLGASVTPGQQLSVVVGAGGDTGFYNSNINNGGDSSIGEICSAKGGKGSDGTADGSDGGSGAGCFGSAGGQDGHDGASKNDYGWYGGKGQGTTTRYFGESTGTLYSTGGCGSGWFGGAGLYCEKTPNTGDGATGLPPSSGTPSGYDYDGASGICIIRWSGK